MAESGGYSRVPFVPLWPPRCAGVSAQQAGERQQRETHPPVGSGRRAGAEAERSRCQVGGRGPSVPAALAPVSPCS